MTSYLASQNAVRGVFRQPGYAGAGRRDVCLCGGCGDVTNDWSQHRCGWAAPVVAGYVTHMGNPSFARPYDEAVLYTMVAYQDKMVGAYPFGLFLAGPGAEMALVAGREGASIPKKLADQIQIKHDDTGVRAQVIRHGTTLIDVCVNAGNAE